MKTTPLRAIEHRQEKFALALACNRPFGDVHLWDSEYQQSNLRAKIRPATNLI